MEKKNKYPILLLTFLTSILIISSCAVRKNQLFKIPKGTEFAFDTIPTPPYPDYKIAVDDHITFTVLTNNGESIFIGRGQSFGQGEFIVRSDGKTYIPLLGDMYLLGMTVKECEEFLKEKFSKYINDPYIKLNISNSRVVIFKGDGSTASIFNITNAKTTVLEVIASTGGIPFGAKSNNIKIIRNVNGKIKIFKIDLSTIDKIEQGNMLVQANDYILIETAINYPVEILREFTPYLTPITFLISTITIFKTITK
jgi:protein involved in polysaccharide export with SLBB domain